jgi:hypothetical protein
MFGLLVQSKEMTQPPVDPDRKTVEPDRKVDSWGLDLYDWLLILAISFMVCLNVGHGAHFMLIWDAVAFAIAVFFIWCMYGIVKNLILAVSPKNAEMIQKIIELLSIAVLGVVTAKIFGA